MSRGRTKISKSARAAVIRRDGHKCVHCGAKSKLTMDHVVPLSLGGSNGQGNLQTLCQRCNERKGSTSPALWFESDLEQKIYAALTGDAAGAARKAREGTR